MARITNMFFFFFWVAVSVTCSTRDFKVEQFMTCAVYLGVRMAIPSNVTTASSPPAPTSATDMILSRKT